MTKNNEILRSLIKILRKIMDNKPIARLIGDYLCFNQNLANRSKSTIQLMVFSWLQ